MIGRTLSDRYRIVEQLGQGGMGVVYRAVDSRLDRTVALKVLPADAGDDDRKRRFKQEAVSASALNHPNIVTTYDIDSSGDVDFIVMEHVEGQPLDRGIRAGSLPIDEALGLAVQVTDALAAAHGAGIVHRDIKPSNIMVTAAGQAKLLDFGLAKLRDPRDTDAEGATMTGARTAAGVVLGTAAYMSPEQAEGKPVDARGDVFAMGIVLYEMLAGRRPFEGESDLSVIAAVLRDTPPPLTMTRRDVPPALERIVAKCLEKSPRARYPSARELHGELLAAQTALAPPARGRRAYVYAAVALGVAIVAVTIGVRILIRESRAQWARNELLPQIARALDREDTDVAFQLMIEAEKYIPDDAELRRLRPRVTVPVTVKTEPPGAQVEMKSLARPDAQWTGLGTTPIDNGRIPATPMFRLRITKDGFEPVEKSVFGIIGSNQAITLSPRGSWPRGMVPVRGAAYRYLQLPPVTLDDFWIDRYEVTNAEFKAFVDGGGYARPQFWKHTFVKEGRALTFDAAMRVFRDSTGRPGPATWELGTFPDGRGDYPVAGVSWYEAAAYAEFAGKALPTLYHWYYATGNLTHNTIVDVSNFARKGPARVGAYQGIGPFGTYDMAGNIKEWCFNATGARRFILGGDWSEPTYMFGERDAHSPFDRGATFGFRCIKLKTPLSAAIVAPIESPERDITRERPVADDIFETYRRFYAYDAGAPLRSALELVEETPHWRREKATIDVAGQRVPVYLYLPRSAASPYQTVVHFPGGYAFFMPSSRNVGGEVRLIDFLMRSGRAVVTPVYQGTYERRAAPGGGGPSYRDTVIQWVRETGRTIDYLATRSDIDTSRLAYYGLSAGATAGTKITALEPRFKASILAGGGLLAAPREPATEDLNFAPRIKVPTLMVNGRADFLRPYETSQVPLFRLIGTDPAHKKHAVFDGGHVPPRVPMIKEALEWLDRYLGPVQQQKTQQQ
jgi:predicted esterase